MSDAIRKLNETPLLALMGYAEARSEGYTGIVAVMSVARNRARRSGRELTEIILQPKQFSCFNSDDPQYPNLVEIASNWKQVLGSLRWLRACLWLAGGVISGDFPSPVGNATHYFAGPHTPEWSKDPKKMQFVTMMGRHLFFEELQGPFALTRR